jgi:hypothetical protein
LTVRELWPAADEQRCTVHALRNVTATLPERHHRELKARWWKVFDEADSAAEARRGLDAIIADYRSAYPSAMAVIERDLDALVAHLRWPSEHRKRIRTTDENVKDATIVSGRVSGDGSVAAGARRAADRLPWPRFRRELPDRPDCERQEPSSRGDVVWRSGVSGR